MLAVEVSLEVNLTPDQIAAAVQRGHESAMVEIGQTLADVARQCITTGTDPWGEPWAPHDPDTKPGTLGQRTGAMLASVYSTPTEPTAGVTRAEAGVAAPYAKYFQGRRPILPLTFDRGFTARGRRGRRRVDSVDMPPALLDRLVAIDLRHVQAALDEMKAEVAARAEAATESHDSFVEATSDWYGE